VIENVLPRTIRVISDLSVKCIVYCVPWCCLAVCSVLQYEQKIHPKFLL
jgi:hypothetical protein